MARTEHKRRQNFRGFLILVAVMMIGAVILWKQGELINPLESTELLLNTSSGANGFAMVGDDHTAPDNSVVSSQSNTSNTSDTSTSNKGTSAESPAKADAAANAVSTTGTMTLETLTAELAAAGVDVDAVTADMKAQGRSLDNLLAVVNSGRVTVADLATRLKGESNNAPAPSAVSNDNQGDRQESTGLLDIHWDELGSVGYDLWFILAVTVGVIIIARPFGWLVNRMKWTK